MSKKIQHQKKRNTGLLYEFLTHYISGQLVQGNRDKYLKAIKILKSSFKKNSELMKEFKLMRSLLKATVSTHVVGEVMTEAKQIARSMDIQKLDREKSLLIKNINYHLNENNNFYDIEVPNYKTYATAQILFNMWRDPSSDVGVIGQFSTRLIEHLTSDKTKLITEDSNNISNESHGTVRLLMKVMTQSLNEKYSEALSSNQKSLIKTYAYSAVSSEPESIKKKLDEIKNSVIDNIEQYSKVTNSTVVQEKLADTKQKIMQENTACFDEATIVRFLSYVKLNDELLSTDPAK